jgi:ABC-type polysaccharide/polyol phosphate transport system ATPase subunit
MNSTTTSEKILSVDKLNVVFRLRYYEQRTVRGVFVDLATRPVDALLKTQDSLHILKNISFSLSKGDRVAVLGVNGSGKTSLCRCIAGMLSPASGEIKIRGRCRAVFDTGVGVIPELTGRENARLLATLMFPEEDSARVARLAQEAMEFSELGGFLDVPYETYSQGMKARLFLSVVTAKPADLLIFDEVYDNTDRFFQAKMTERLARFIHGADAFLFVSHSAEQIKKSCNRAIVLHESKIAFDGDVDRALEVYDFLNGVFPEKLKERL